MNDDDDLDYECPGRPDHSYELFDEADGIAVYICRDCGAETVEGEDDD